MKRLMLGVMLGLLLGSVAHGEEDPLETVLTENPMGTLSRTHFKVPPSYGPLMDVAVSSDVHYLYFQDEFGTIRIVPVGQRAAAQRSRAPIQLLSTDVFVIERGGRSVPAPADEPAR
jgi:hypothetical protein